MIPFGSAEEVAAAIPAVVAHLARRGVIAYPTETVYGLGSTVDRIAVERLGAVKRREPGRPFLLLVSGVRMIGAAGLRFPETAERLAAAFWPGPLTLVLPGGERELSPALRGPEGGIAVRWTSHPAVNLLTSTLGSPITSTSANRTSRPPAASPGEIAAEFREEVDRGDLLLLDGGVLAPSAPSTVVDCTVTPPRLVRAGALAAELLASVVPALGRGS